MKVNRTFHVHFVIKIFTYPKMLKYLDSKTINFPFVSNGKLIVFRCHKYLTTIGCLKAKFIGILLHFSNRFLTIKVVNIL